MNEVSTMTDQPVEGSTTTVKVNGKTFEVELSVVNQIDNLKVGSQVGVLEKTYSGQKFHRGVIMGIQNFEPDIAIIVAYINVDISDVVIKEAIVLDGKEDFRIAPLNCVPVPLDENRCLAILQKKIREKQADLDTAIANLHLFKEQFATMLKSEGTEEND